MRSWQVTTSSGSNRDAVRLAIARAADKTGADFTYLLNQAKSESGLNPNAKAGTSSAAGLYQFIDQSWLGVLKQHGSEHGYGWAANAIRSRPGGGWSVDPAARQAVFALRNDPDAASLMAAEFANDNRDGLAQALGRDPTSTDLYFAHFLGLAGAKRFLKAAYASPDASAASVFPREAAANRSIFYTRSGDARSLAQVYALMGRKIDGPAQNPITAPIQMASAEQALSATPPSDVRLVDLPASNAAQASSEAMLAARTGQMNLLRPTPEQAMLAYMVVAAPYMT